MRKRMIRHSNSCLWIESNYWISWCRYR